MKYYKRYWKESTGDTLTDHWGFSMYYFETNEEGIVLRQLQQFENGQNLKYCTTYIDDKYGGLSEVALDLKTFQDFEINPAEFETIWNKAASIRFPEIVSTKETLQGSPRLEGRRLSVGDIVHLLDDNEIYILQQEFHLSLQQIRQALHYCSIRQCKQQKVLKYCHNCTLRAKQKGKEVEDEQDNWVRAEQLLKKYFNR